MAIIKWKIGVTEVKERILNSSELESNGLRYTAISTIEIKVKHNVKNSLDETQVNHSGHHILFICDHLRVG